MRRFRGEAREAKKQEPVSRVMIESPGFAGGQPIPRKYTEDGANISPAIVWRRLPAGAKTVAIVCDDPDAPRTEPWVHWIIYDIPAVRSGLPEAISPVARPSEVPGALQGVNDFGKVGYGGPAPPPGHGTHHYHFTLYALDEEIPIAPRDVTKRTLLQAMKGHTVGFGELIGTYGR